MKANEKRYLLILGFVWLTVQIIMFLIFGIKTGWEGMKYQEDAQLFLDIGQLNPVRYFFSAYSLLIAFF